MDYFIEASTSTLPFIESSALTLPFVEAATPRLPFAKTATGLPHFEIFIVISAFINTLVLIPLLTPRCSARDLAVL